MYMILAGILIAVYLLIAYFPTSEGLTPTAQKAIGVMVSAVLSWIFEILPFSVSAILFTVLPAIFGIMPLDKVMGYFATSILFFLFAMFVTSIAFTNSSLSHRLVCWLSLKSKGNPKTLLFLTMAACGLLSTVIADLPVVAMMLPVALMLLKENECLPGCSAFGKALTLGIAIASLIGGIGTPAGGSPNVMVIGLLGSTVGKHISFFQWCAIGIPMVLVLIPLSYFFLIKAFPPEMEVLHGLDKLEREYRELGSMSRKEKSFLGILLINLIFWSTDKLHGIPLPAVSVIGCALYSIPYFGLIEWKNDKNSIGWDVIMVTGCANALGMVIWELGGAKWLANSCLGGFVSWPIPVVIIAICVFTIFIHLLIPSGPGIIAVLLPVLASLAGSMNIDPTLLIISMGFSTAAAVLLPLDPIVLLTYQAGYYRMVEMLKPGIFIAICWVGAVCGLILLLGDAVELI